MDFEPSKDTLEIRFIHKLTGINTAFHPYVHLVLQSYNNEKPTSKRLNIDLGYYATTYSDPYTFTIQTASISSNSRMCPLPLLFNLENDLKYHTIALNTTVETSLYVDGKLFECSHTLNTLPTGSTGIKLTVTSPSELEMNGLAPSYRITRYAGTQGKLLTHLLHSNYVPYRP